MPTKRAGGSAGALLVVAVSAILLLACRETKVVIVVATPTPGATTAQAQTEQQQGRATPAPTAQRGATEGRVQVQATVETEPVPSSGDAADDIAIWVHPSDPAQSLVIGTDKEGGSLFSYGLDGRVVQRLDIGRVNNVDLREGFRLGDATVTLVAASNRSNDSIALLRLDASRQMTPLNVEGDRPGINIYGLCMYRSPAGRFYVYVTEEDGPNLQQFEVQPASGGVSLRLVRSLRIGSVSEGCVADDALGRLYVGEEEVGIWRYGAEPDAGNAREQVDATRGGNLRADVEGLAIYYAGRDGGYLIASSQGNDSFVIYDRQSNTFVGVFQIVDGGLVDGVDETDGIDVSNAALGPSFPRGLFVAQDGANSQNRGRARQNFKLVPWEAIASSFEPDLIIDTSRR